MNDSWLAVSLRSALATAVRVWGNLVDALPELALRGAASLFVGYR